MQSMYEESTFSISSHFPFYEIPNLTAATKSRRLNDRQALEKLAEKEFRKARELTQGTDLTDAGFFWGEKFKLPFNFELQKEGIYFWYNPFEVAAYALGPTDFVISYSDLGKLLNRDVIF